MLMNDVPPDDDDRDGVIPPLKATGLQEQLSQAGDDLERLQRLLSDASDMLLLHFCGASNELRPLLAGGAPAPGLASALGHLDEAVAALQFQDMASQLIGHVHRRLRNCAGRIARYTADDDSGAAAEQAPLASNPVARDRMDAGPVELF